MLAFWLAWSYAAHAQVTTGAVGWCVWQPCFDYWTVFHSSPLYQSAITFFPHHSTSSLSLIWWEGDTDDSCTTEHSVLSILGTLIVIWYCNNHYPLHKEVSLMTWQIQKRMLTAIHWTEHRVLNERVRGRTQEAEGVCSSIRGTTMWTNQYPQSSHL